MVHTPMFCVNINLIIFNERVFLVEKSSVAIVHEFIIAISVFHIGHL